MLGGDFNMLFNLTYKARGGNLQSNIQSMWWKSKNEKQICS